MSTRNKVRLLLLSTVLLSVGAFVVLQQGGEQNAEPRLHPNQDIAARLDRSSSGNAQISDKGTNVAGDGVAFRESAKFADATSDVSGKKQNPQPSEASDVTTVAYVQPEPKVVDISFDDVKFEMDKEKDKFKRSMLTDKIRELDGNRIQVRGYMQPNYKQKGIKSFIFVRDNKECCFGPGAALYDCMIVKMKKGKSTSFRVSPFAVEGDFYVEEFEGPEGETLAIYRLKNAEVK